MYSHPMEPELSRISMTLGSTCTALPLASGALAMSVFAASAGDDVRMNDASVA